MLLYNTTNLCVVSFARSAFNQDMIIYYIAILLKLTYPYLSNATHSTRRFILLQSRYDAIIGFDFMATLGLCPPLAFYTKVAWLFMNGTHFKDQIELSHCGTAPFQNTLNSKIIRSCTYAFLKCSDDGGCLNIDFENIDPTNSELKSIDRNT